MFTLPTQPMTLNDAIKNTFKLWKETLVAVLPLSIISGLITSFSEIAAPLQETNHILFITLSIFSLLISIVFTTAILAKVGHAAHNQPITNSQALATGLVKFFPVLGSILILCIILFGFLGIITLLFSHIPVLLLLGYLLLLLLSCILLIYILCTVPLIVFENLNPLAAIKKSIAMTKNHFWFGGLLMTVVSIFMIALYVPAIYLFQSTWGSMVVYFFIVSLQSSMVIIFYEYLKSQAIQQGTTAILK